MPLSTDDAIEVLSSLSNDANLRVAVTESVKAGILTGTMTVVGGLIAGPVGLAVGGGIGGCIAAATAKSFKPVPQILKEMDPHQRQELARHFNAIFENIDVCDVATVLMLLSGQKLLLDQAIKMLTNYLNNEMKMKVDE